MLLVGIIGVFSTFQIYSLFKLSSHLQNHVLVVKSNAVHEIQVDVGKIVNRMNKLVYFSNEIDLTKTLAMIAVYEKNIYLNFNLIEQKFRGDKRYFDKVTHLFEEWKAIRHETLALYKKGQVNEAKYILFNGKGTKQVQKLSKALDNLHQFMEEKADQFSVKTHSGTKQIFQISIAMVILILMLEWLIFTMSRKVIKDVMLASNDTNPTPLNEAVESNHQAETTQLKQSLETMPTELKQSPQTVPQISELQTENHQFAEAKPLTETLLPNVLEPTLQTKANRLGIKPVPKPKIGTNQSFTALFVEEDMS
jgi:hypothetical protein